MIKRYSHRALLDQEFSGGLLHSANGEGGPLIIVVCVLRQVGHRSGSKVIFKIDPPLAKLNEEDIILECGKLTENCKDNYELLFLKELWVERTLVA